MKIRISIAASLFALTLSAGVAQTTPRKPHITSDEMGTARVLEQPNPKDGIFEMKLTGKDGQVRQWYQYFKDEDGKILIEVIRKTGGHDETAPYEEVQFIKHYTYRSDGNIATVHEYFGDGRLRSKIVYQYDESGRFLRGDVFRDGKRVGHTTTPPDDLMYGAKRKAQPGAPPNPDSAPLRRDR